MSIPPPTSVLTRVAGRYELLRELGRGGMGVVHLAYDVELRRQVALKQRCKAGTSHAERFRRETHALAAIEHSGVPRLLHSGRCEGGEPFFTMELVRGETLRALLERGPLEPGRALTLAIDLGRVLAAIHRAGIVHRDVKPDNIIVEPGDRVRLIDFGACYLTGSYYRQPHLRSVTATGERWGTGEQEFVGTVAYTDPEYFTEGATSPQSDVFSVCVVLYEMLTGRRLHDVATQGFRKIDAAELPGHLLDLAVELQRGVSASYRRHPSMDDLVRQLEIVRCRRTTAPPARRGALLAPFAFALGAFALGTLVAVLLRTGTTPASEANAERAGPFQPVEFSTDMSPRTHAVSAPLPVAASEPQMAKPGPLGTVRTSQGTRTKRAEPTEQTFEKAMVGLIPRARGCARKAGLAEGPQSVRVRGNPETGEVKSVRIVNMSLEHPFTRCIAEMLREAGPPLRVGDNSFTFFSGGGQR